MTEYEMRPPVKRLAERVQSLFEHPVTISETDIKNNYQEVVDAFVLLADRDKEQFICFLLGYSWGARQHIKGLSLASNSEPRQNMWT